MPRMFDAYSIRLVGGLGELHATSLATPTGLDLRLDDRHAADLLGSRLGGIGALGHLAQRRHDPMLGEELLRLELHQIHDRPSPSLFDTPG